ncbi:MAG: 16S rRNA pseudouridine(516) synthase [Ruminococcus sp.]|nr:16S rRNA pseudouridine(516) synthase [Ruminococcus sp.]
MRLDKFLSERTAYSRSQIKELIAAKKVTVNGTAAGKANLNVAETDTVCLGGQAVRSQKMLTVLLNKPAGYVSATEDRTERTVLELLPPELQGQGLFPVGRLDKDTTGMLLLTNDGALSHRLTAPKKHVPKFYEVTLARPFEASCTELFASGMTLGNGDVCLPAEVGALTEDGRKALVCLHEGKYHQVKRMFAAAGNHVVQLHRIGMGGLLLPDDLPLGKAFVLLDKDLWKVLNSGIEFSALLQKCKKCSSLSMNELEKICAINDLKKA